MRYTIEYDSGLAMAQDIMAVGVNPHVASTVAAAMMTALNSGYDNMSEWITDLVIEVAGILHFEHGIDIDPHTAKQFLLDSDFNTHLAIHHYIEDIEPDIRASEGHNSLHWLNNN